MFFCNVLSLPSGLGEDIEPNSSLHENSRLTCQRTCVESQCSPKSPGTTTAIKSQRSSCLSSCGGDMRRSWTEEEQHDIKNVLMDVDDFEQEVTVASEPLPH